MKKGLQTTILLTLAVVSFTIIMIVFHRSRKENSSTYTMDRTEEPGESETSGCSVNWGLTGDQICDDETNTEECHFDLGDCCDGQNDFSLSVCVPTAFATLPDTTPMIQSSMIVFGKILSILSTGRFVGTENATRN